jgi:hypothetical protein
VLFESVFYDEFCKLQKIKKRTLKIARLRKTGKNSDESPPKVGFLRSANNSIFSSSIVFIFYPSTQHFNYKWSRGLKFPNKVSP